MTRRAHGEGSIFTRKVNGRIQWIAQTASPECRWFTSMKSQTHAIDKRAAYLKKRSGNMGRVHSSQLVAEYLGDWLDSRDVRSRTRSGYRSIIKSHINPMIGTMRVRDVQPQHVQMTIDSITSRWMRWQAFRLIRSSFRQLVKWEKIERDPTALVDTPAKPDSVVSPISDANFYALIDEVKKDRLCALWLIYLTIGPRRGEAIAIRESTDVHLQRVTIDKRKTWIGTMTFTRSLQRVDGALRFLPAKTPKGNRTVTLTSPVAEALHKHIVQQKERRLKAGAKWKGDDDHLVFTTKIGTRLEPRNVTRRWHQLLTKAGVSQTKLHNARHTVISILLREGVDIYAVQQLAGHSKPSITTDIYGHLMSAPGVTAEAMERMLKRDR